MVVLNEALMRVKTKQEDLTEVKNLNVCGQGIDDISILQHVPNIEVLSLSVNKIGSLRYFAFCSQLKQLYLRANAIHDLAEVRYLMTLRDLKVLWLADNPCTKLPHYRAFVVANLPGLENLDNVAVNDADRQAARGIRVLQVATAADVAAEDEAADAQAQAEEEAASTPQHTPLPSTTPRQQLPSISPRPSSAASTTPLPSAAAPPSSMQRRRSLSRPASPGEQQQQSYTGGSGAQDSSRRRSSHISHTVAATAPHGAAGNSTMGSAAAATAAAAKQSALRASPEPPAYAGNTAGSDSSLQQSHGCSVTPRDLGFASCTGIAISPGEMADTTSRQLFGEHSTSHMAAQQHQQDLRGQPSMCPSSAEQACPLTGFGPSVPHRVQQLQHQQQQVPLQMPLQMPPWHVSYSPVPTASRTNVLYAVMALLGELDASGLSIVQREVQMRLMEHH